MLRGNRLRLPQSAVLQRGRRTEDPGSDELLRKPHLQHISRGMLHLLSADRCRRYAVTEHLHGLRTADAVLLQRSGTAEAVR